MRGSRSILSGSRHALRFAFGLSVLSLAPAASASDPHSRAASEVRGAEFSLLTYNVAGLPAVLSAGEPERNSSTIGSLLNLYDVALVQEDFVYHSALDLTSRHPHRSDPFGPGVSTTLGDGLNRFSRTPFARFKRYTWATCHGRFSAGSDCLTEKGFSVGEHFVAPGYSVDVYNVHLDAGDSPGDRAARAAQLDQLYDAMKERSTNRPVIIAGDTNLDENDSTLLVRFLQRSGLIDTCRSLSCDTPQLIDRVMYRSSDRLRLSAARFMVDPRFVHTDGRDLSDHKAVGVVFRWEPVAPKTPALTRTKADEQGRS